MTITKRLIVMLSVALLALLLVGGFGIRALYQAQQRFEDVQTNTLPSILELFGARSDLANQKVRFRDLLLADDADKSAISRDIDDLSKSFDQHLATYGRDDISDDTDRKMLETNKANEQALRAQQDNFRSKLASGDLDGAKQLLKNGGTLVAASSALNASLGVQVDYNLKLSAQTRQANNDSYSFTLWLLVGIITVAFLAAAGLGIQLYDIVRRGLGGLQNTLQNVSRSLDLTRMASIVRMDEIGHTSSAFNALLTRVAEVVSEVRGASNSVSVASRQIASGNVDLSARTEQQAASLEETAASMEELTTTVKQNTDSARQASTLAANARDISTKGNETVERMVGTMSQIAANSAKISDITTLIEGVAFQTNILALNAAVEAARAGEQGRGFAVVASEVRSLAQRSSSAAKEIKDLITTSVSTIHEGSTQAQEVGRTTLESLEAVRQVADIIDQIAAASDEQGRGIEQVNQAVSQMDQVTQQNAALVEEAAAAAQSLEEQARKLDEMVSVFRTAA
jgi:methyl-accepting chemotaxis protein